MSFLTMSFFRRRSDEDDGVVGGVVVEDENEEVSSTSDPTIESSVRSDDEEEEEDEEAEEDDDDAIVVGASSSSSATTETEPPSPPDDGDDDDDDREAEEDEDDVAVVDDASSSSSANDSSVDDDDEEEEEEDLGTSTGGGETIVPPAFSGDDDGSDDGGDDDGSPPRAAHPDDFGPEADTDSEDCDDDDRDGGGGGRYGDVDDGVSSSSPPSFATTLSSIVAAFDSRSGLSELSLRPSMVGSSDVETTATEPSFAATARPSAYDETTTTIDASPEDAERSRTTSMDATESERRFRDATASVVASPSSSSSSASRDDDSESPPPPSSFGESKRDDATTTTAHPSHDSFDPSSFENVARLLLLSPSPAPQDPSRSAPSPARDDGPIAAADGGDAKEVGGWYATLSESDWDELDRVSRAVLDATDREDGRIPPPVVPAPLPPSALSEAYDVAVESEEDGARFVTPSPLCDETACVAGRVLPSEFVCGLCQDAVVGASIVDCDRCGGEGRACCAPCLEMHEAASSRRPSSSSSEESHRRRSREDDDGFVLVDRPPRKYLRGSVDRSDGGDGVRPHPALRNRPRRLLRSSRPLPPPTTRGGTTGATMPPSCPSCSAALRARPIRCRAVDVAVLRAVAASAARSPETDERDLLRFRRSYYRRYDAWRIEMKSRIEEERERKRGAILAAIIENEEELFWKKNDGWKRGGGSSGARSRRGGPRGSHGRRDDDDDGGGCASAQKPQAAAAATMTWTELAMFVAAFAASVGLRTLVASK